eukprot:CAMPEP_0197514948 /NCGR_PEP_ID=MMETSP1318-20131121/225_1 /TAXON_ID=552666 /ORGANISM="Partenskyella glossopodia, Strain RCC365" /LENGTH=366 /DNA_ID=CAMNT_0043063179 /DNA_START=75 /DNA_END=1175 /DNA_ORIENTATION=+
MDEVRQAAQIMADLISHFNVAPAQTRKKAPKRKNLRNRHTHDHQKKTLRRGRQDNKAAKPKRSREAINERRDLINSVASIQIPTASIQIPTENIRDKQCHNPKANKNVALVTKPDNRHPSHRLKSSSVVFKTTFDSAHHFETASPERQSDSIAHNMARTRASLAKSGKVYRWARCSKAECGRWRRLNRMVPFESLCQDWKCPDCDEAEEVLEEEIVLQDDMAKRVYAKEKDDFYEHIKKYLESIGLRPQKELVTQIGGQAIDLYRLYREVTAKGGCDAVTSVVGLWRDIYERLNPKGNKVADASYRLKLIYKQCLYLYEQHFFFNIKFLKGSSDAAPYVKPIAISRKRELKLKLDRRTTQKKLNFS